MIQCQSYGGANQLTDYRFEQLFKNQEHQEMARREFEEDLRDKSNKILDKPKEKY
jgi:hypothetical protein